jgi:hypothetical protein
MNQHAPATDHTVLDGFQQVPAATITPNCGILTIANGAPQYHEMAKSLARSIRRFSPGIPLAIVTDRPDIVGGYFDHVIEIDPSRGKSVRQKLFIDLYTPFVKTLFIDSDCIVFGDLAYAFAELEGGKNIISDDIYDLSVSNPREIDFQLLHKKTGHDKLYGFNGGVYYVEKGTPSEQVFQQGRLIDRQFDQYGIPVFREDEANDEYILAVAIALCGCPLVPVTRQLMQIPLGLSGRLKLDVILGKSEFVAWGKPVNPAMVHFCGYFRDWPIYERECGKLRILESQRWWSGPMAACFGVLFDLSLVLRRAGRRLWGNVPKPFRLVFHAILTRINRYWR